MAVTAVRQSIIARALVFYVSFDFSFCKAALSPWHEGHNAGIVDPNYTNFLIISQPNAATVEYFVVNSTTGQLGDDAHFLLGVDADLVQPKAIAVDAIGKVLYVTDPGQARILSYDLALDANLALLATNPQVVLSDVTTDWIQIDSYGKLFYSQENPVGIYQLDTTTSGQVESVLPNENLLSNTSTPGGVATDGVSVIFTNNNVDNLLTRIATGPVYRTDADGVRHADRTVLDQYTSHLVVVSDAVAERVDDAGETETAADDALAVSGDEDISDTESFAGQTPTSLLQVQRQLATSDSNNNSPMGVCISNNNNVFYTHPSGNLSVVKKDKSLGPRLLTSGMGQPRQCVFDGNTTVYVADGDGQIWAVPSTRLITYEEDVTISKLRDGLTDPYGIAFVAMAQSSAALLSTTVLAGLLVFVGIVA